MGHRFTFSGNLWEWTNEAAPWVFVTLPTEVADEIDDLVPTPGGFGSVRVAVEIGATRWSTSLFPDKKSGSFVLPLKRAVRDAERLSIGDAADVTITLVHRKDPVS